MKKNLQSTNYKLQTKNGFSLVEIVVVTAVIITAFVAILQLAAWERRSQTSARENIGAYLLAREALEATRSVRDSNWSNISSLSFATLYYPVISSGAWQLSATNPGSIGIYSRSVQVQQVLRDANDNISASGTADSDTRRVIATVSWTTAGNNARSITLETYLTKWQAFR